MKTVHISTHELARNVLRNTDRGICLVVRDMVADTAGVRHYMVSTLANSHLVASLLRECFFLDHDVQELCLRVAGPQSLDPAAATLRRIREEMRVLSHHSVRRAFAQRLLQRPDRLVVAISELFVILGVDD